ncbi:MAG TPA: DUF1844 domain-containing protein [Candidatus Omnitrophota bacterium]|nr:DUF1844 domain-containing protein [Candidatus Omnitrophota bacterium]
MDRTEGTDFSFFISSLAMQASIALGIMAHPITNRTETNLSHARLIIDTLAMLKEKTTGNLTTDEDSLLDKFLYELRKKYAENTSNRKKEGQI